MDTRYVQFLRDVIAEHAGRATCQDRISAFATIHHFARPDRCEFAAKFSEEAQQRDRVAHLARHSRLSRQDLPNVARDRCVFETIMLDNGLEAGIGEDADLMAKSHKTTTEGYEGPDIAVGAISNNCNHETDSNKGS